MLYRENGQFKGSYSEDQQILPIVQDRWFMLALLAVAYFVLPAVATDYAFRALIIPFLILAIAAIARIRNGMISARNVYSLASTGMPT